MSIYNENIFRNYDEDHGIANHHATVILTEQNMKLNFDVTSSSCSVHFYNKTSKNELNISGKRASFRFINKKETKITSNRFSGQTGFILLQLPSSFFRTSEFTVN